VSRGPSICALHLAVEPADAAEPRGQRHVPHRQRRFVEQLLGEVKAPGLCDVEWRGADMTKEEAAQMA